MFNLFNPKPKKIRMYSKEYDELDDKVKILENKMEKEIEEIDSKLDKKVETVADRITVSREKIDKMDKEIWRVQKSTKTLFKAFNKVHNELRSKYKFYYNWHLNPYSDLTHWIVLIMAFILSIYLVGFQFGFFGGRKPASMAVAGIPKMINYQGKLTDANNVPVANGAYNMILTIYDASAAGNVLWSSRESDACGAAFNPSAKSITVANGLFSTLLGETGDCPLNLDFNTDEYWLGVTVGADAEMTPRKRIGAVGYAYNSDTVDGKHETDFALLAGRSGGQSLSGGTAASNNLTLDSTTNGTKGYVNLNPSGGFVGVGTATPGATLEVKTTSTSAVAGLLVTQYDLDQIGMTLGNDTSATATLFNMTTKSISGNMTNLAWNGAVQATGNVVGFYADFTNLTPTNNGANNVYGLNVNDPAANNSSLAYGLYVQGTNWDYALYTETSSYLAGILTVANYNSAVGAVKFLELTGSGTNSVSLKAPDTLAGDTTYVLPTADGSSGNSLKTDGSGNLSWSNSASNYRLATYSNLVINQDPTANLIQINVTADSVVAWDSTANLSYEIRGVNESAQLRSQPYTNDPASGDSITLNVTSTNALSAGNYVRVSSSAGTEETYILSIVANTSITVAHLNLNHTTSSPMITKVWGSDAGGLDTGLEAASTWYYVWLTTNSSGTYNIFLSTSATTPTTTATGFYSYKRLLGVIFNDGSSDILAFNQKNDTYLWAAPLKVGDNVGSATTASLSLSAAVPPSIAKGVFGKVMTNGPAFWCYSPKTFGNSLGVDNNIVQFSVFFSAVNNSLPWDLPVLVESQTMYHQASAASVDIWVSGFRFNF